MEETHRILMRALDMAELEARGFVDGWNAEPLNTVKRVSSYTRGWLAGRAARAIISTPIPGSILGRAAQSEA